MKKPQATPSTGSGWQSFKPQGSALRGSDRQLRCSDKEVSKCLSAGCFAAVASGQWTVTSGGERRGFGLREQ